MLFIAVSDLVESHPELQGERVSLSLCLEKMGLQENRIILYVSRNILDLIIHNTGLIRRLGQ